MFDTETDSWADDLVDEMLDELDAEAFAAAVALRPPGRCTWPRHNALQRQVRATCDRQRACHAGMTGCANLSQRVLFNVRCASARNAINVECYGGGDADHRTAERQAGQAANTCRQLWRGRNCGLRPRGGRNVRRFD